MGDMLTPDDLNPDELDPGKRAFDVRALLRKFAPYLSLALIFLLLALLRPESFLSQRNLSNVLRQTAPIAIMAIGETVVIITAGIDLSVGSLMAFGGICGTLAMRWGVPVVPAIGIAILCGGLMGLLNGVIISRSRVLPFVLTCMGILLVGELGLRTEDFLAAQAGELAWSEPLRVLLLRLGIGLVVLVPLAWFMADLEISPFIATLGTLGMARGYTLYIASGQPVTGLPGSFGALGQGSWLGIPIPALILLAVALLIHLLLTRTRYGRYVYAIGSNAETARLSGIDIQRVTRWTYTISGMTSGLAGIMMMARMATGQPTEFEGYELDGIAAVVIGGGSLAGGSGSVLGSIAGAFVMSLLRNGGNLLNINDFLQRFMIGAIIVIAVAFDAFRRQKLSRR